MKRMMIGLAVFAALIALAPLSGFAQTTPDPATQKAREDTAIVFDLGRVFGYLNLIEKDSKVPALSADQLKKLYDIALELKNAKRIEPSRAKLLLAQVEDRILTPAQLMAIDKLAAAKESERANVQGSGAGSNAGASSGAGSLATYIAGGDFNPLIDKSKTMGQDFFAFFDYLSKKLGK
jgi:hypothetical protein